MLLIRPGITDLASLVFADEGEILSGSADPDLLYNQIIRPWKSRLALLYAERRTLRVDLTILFLTLAGAVSRARALQGVQAILKTWGAEPLLISMASRSTTLEPWPPPGASEIAGHYPRHAAQS
jgi:hypothetical protein